MPQPNRKVKMPSCEKCWEDAFIPYIGTDVDKYWRLLKERENNPCSPKEQAGQWWDEEKQCDSRLTKPESDE